MLTELRNKLQVRYYLHYNKAMSNDSIDLPISTFYKRLYGDRYNLYDIIPQSKIREEKDHLDALSHAIPDVSESMVKSYNDNVVKHFREIEKSGLWTESGFEYTKYNLFTTTGRPSNSNNGINYAGLNKESGTRSKYISRHPGGIIAELDYDAYHLRLIANLVDIEQPKGSFHRYLGKLYFDTAELTDEQYQDSKKISFQILYGGIPKEFLHIDYFKRTNEYIFKLWDIYNSKGYIETPILKRRFYKRNFKDMNPQKLFNYYIQALETETNSRILKNILDMLENKFSKIILYVYDAFVFDISSDDGKEILSEIKKLMELPTKVKIGRDYHNMRSLDL